MLATGQRVRFCLGTPDIIQARFAVIGRGAYGEGTIQDGPEGDLYIIGDLEVFRGEEDLATRRTDPYGLGDSVYVAAEELEVAPLRINQETTFGEVHRMLNKATAHLEEGGMDGGWSPIYDWVKIPHTKGFWDHMTLEELRFVAVYHATGGSEGHYIHVDMISGVGDGGIKGTGCFLAKTFGGREHAQLIQNTVQLLLDV